VCGRERDRRGHAGALAGPALDDQLAALSGDAVAQADKAAAVGPRSALAVVSHLDMEPAVLHPGDGPLPAPKSSMRKAWRRARMAVRGR
jgi:hypothetical protein